MSLAAVLLLVALAAAPNAEVPRLASGKAQLDFARARKLEMRGLEGSARSRARAKAVEAYRAVRAHHPEARAAGAEAAFRAGELLRAGGDLGQGLEEFEVARELGRGTVFHARALLEIGHVHRRSLRRREALDAYLAVIAKSDACACYRDEASLWAGRVWASEGRDADARRAWNRVADEAEDPVDRVRAFDELALLRLARGDPEGAAGELNRCRLALSEVALELTEQGERVRGAMERMRVIAALQRVVEERETRDHAPKTRVQSDVSRKKSRIAPPVLLDIARPKFISHASVPVTTGGRGSPRPSANGL